MNVYQATKLLEFYCSDDFVNLTLAIKTQLINEFLKIDAQLKPQRFRHLNQSQLEHFTSTINGVLKTNLKDDLNAKQIVKITTSFNNNRLGADLIVFYQPKSDHAIAIANIELKFGHETLRNIGNEQMQQIFNLQNKEWWNFEIFSKNLKTNQQDLIKTNPEISEAQLVSHLDQFLEQNCKQMQNLTINQSAILGLINRTTKLKFNDRYEELKTLKYQIKPDLTLIKTATNDEQLSLKSQWKIIHIKKADQSARIEIICANQTWKLKFLLNWKNSAYFNNQKWSAKCGLGTSSWNMWLSKI